MNLALYSNRITPDRGLVHGCSNRSDMNAGISAHFSSTIKSERDTWLRFVHTHRANLNPSGKFVASVFKSISRRNVLQERFIWKVVVVGLFLAQFLQYGRSSQGRQSSKRQHRKVSLVQFYLSFSIVSAMKFPFS